jgi:hypothetical protein
MKKQTTKGKLMELITGTKTNLPRIEIIFTDEEESFDPKLYPENTTFIRFVDFRKRNQEAMENKEIKSDH